MDRRTFNKILGITWSIDPLFMKPLKKTKPYISQKSHIGLIAPSGRLSAQHLEKAKSNLDALGLNYSFSKHVAESDGYLAGADHIRIHDLHAMYDNPEIDAIWCVLATAILRHSTQQSIKEQEAHVFMDQWLHLPCHSIPLII